MMKAKLGFTSNFAYFASKLHLALVLDLKITSKGPSQAILSTR